MQTLHELLVKRDNDYSNLEQAYHREERYLLVLEPYESICHPPAEITISVSIIIPAYNAAATLQQCLISIEQNSFNRKYPHLLEVIVVDDGSNDNTWQILEQAHLNLNLKAVRQANLGCGQARNTGVAISEGDIVICCDADMILLPFTIEELARRHQVLDKVLLVGFRSHVDLTHPQVQLETLPENLKTFLPGYFKDIRLYHPIGGWNLCRETFHLKKLGNGKPIFRPDNSWRALPHQVHGALFSIRRSEYVDIGGCDEQFRGWGYEDTYFAACAIARGNYVIPVYSAGGIHLASDDAFPLVSTRTAKNRQKWQEGAANALYYQEKLSSPFSPPENDWLNHASKRIERLIEHHTANTYHYNKMPPEYYDVYPSVMDNPRTRGLYYLQLGSWQKAIQAFAEIQGTEKEVTEALWLRGKALRLSGEVDATDVFKQLISSSPVNTDVYIEYALALARQERFVEARNQLRRATEMITYHPLLHCLLKRSIAEYSARANLYMRQGDYALALQEYEIALIFDPSHLLLRVNRAKTLEALGKERATQNAQEKYLEHFDDSQSETKTVLLEVWKHVERKEFGQSKVLLEQYLRVHSEETQVRSLLAAIHEWAAQAAPLPLTATILQAVHAIPGSLNEAELRYLIALTTQCIARQRKGPPAVLIDSNSYCGQATITMGLIARKLLARHTDLLAVYQTTEEPVATDSSRLGSILSRDFLQAQLWLHELNNIVTCLPEQRSLLSVQVCHLLLIQGGELPPQIDRYLSLLASEALVLVHPYSDEFPDVQQWANTLLSDSHYTFLGQTGQLLALKAKI